MIHCHEYLAQVPFIGWLTAILLDLIGKLLAKSVRPCTNRLMACLNTTLGKHQFYIAVAEWEGEIEPDGMMSGRLSEKTAPLRGGAKEGTTSQQR